MSMETKLTRQELTHRNNSLLSRLHDAKRSNRVLTDLRRSEVEASNRRLESTLARNKRLELDVKMAREEVAILAGVLKENGIEIPVV